MTITYNDPIDALFQFQQALDAFRTSGWLESSPSGVGTYPPINVFRKGDDVVIIAEVPGVKKEDLRIDIKRNTIRIAGTKSTTYGEKASVHRRERLAGSFDRAISVPLEIDPNGVKAESSDGVLVVFLPRAERDKPRSIKIS